MGEKEWLSRAPWWRRLLCVLRHGGHRYVGSIEAGPRCYLSCWHCGDTRQVLSMIHERSRP